jgi:hypothetical protein
MGVKFKTNVLFPFDSMLPLADDFLNLLDRYLEGLLECWEGRDNVVRSHNVLDDGPGFRPAPRPTQPPVQ